MARPAGAHLGRQPRLRRARRRHRLPRHRRRRPPDHDDRLLRRCRSSAACGCPRPIFPQWLAEHREWLPTHAYAALGQAIELGDAPHGKDVALLAGLLPGLRRRRGLAVPQGHPEGVNATDVGRDPAAPAWGGRPATAVQALRKLLWIGIWLVFMADRSTTSSTAATRLGHRARLDAAWSPSSALYLVLVFRHTARALAPAAVRPRPCRARRARRRPVPHARPALAGPVRLRLVSCGAMLPLRYARWAIVAVTAAMVLLGICRYGPRRLDTSACVVPAPARRLRDDGRTAARAHDRRTARRAPPSPSSPPTRSACASPATCTTSSATRSP